MSRVLMRCARSVASRTAARTGSSSAGTGACGSLPAYVAWDSALSPRCDLPNYPLLVLNACRVSRSPASDAREQPCRAYVGRQQPRAAARLPARVSRCRATTVCADVTASGQPTSEPDDARGVCGCGGHSSACLGAQRELGPLVHVGPGRRRNVRYGCALCAAAAPSRSHEVYVLITRVLVGLWRGGGAANIRCRQAQRLEQRLV